MASITVRGRAYVNTEKAPGMTGATASGQSRAFRTRFRVESEASLSGGEDLEDQLRKRLRIQSFIWAIATLMLGVTALASWAGTTEAIKGFKRTVFTFEF